MNFIITCERCEEYFDNEERTPLILPDWGHTFCETCVAELLGEEEKACPNCGTEITHEDPQNFKKNQKILDLIAKNTNMPHELENQVMCPRHHDKIIEYFCKNCTQTVWVKCMFDDHNGHELLQVDEMTNVLKQNVYDLQKMLVNATRLNEENRKLIEQVKDELSKLKQQQMQNIDKGFMELMKKLEDKKQEIMLEFEKRYKKEEQKFMTKTSLVDTNSEEIKGIEKIFNELLQFINNNPDAKFLQKASDVTTFLHKSFTDLDIITKNQIAQKSEIYIHPSFKPLTLNVKKAIEIVSKFEMLPLNAMPTSREKSTGRTRASKRGGATSGDRPTSD